jgi:hypothetical protein
MARKEKERWLTGPFSHQDNKCQADEHRLNPFPLVAQIGSIKKEKKRGKNQPL